MTNTLPSFAFVVASLAALPASAGELKIYNWADYFGPSTVADFTAATGIDVKLDYFESNDVLETRLLAGQSGYDLVFPAASNAEREFRAGALLPIDVAKLTNYGNLDPDILAAIDALPGGRELGVPYTWGTVGIAYNAAMVEDRLGTAEITSWDVLFRPESAARLADCGIAVLDSPLEMIAVALNYLGNDPYSGDADDIAAAGELLHGLTPSVRYFSNIASMSDLASGNICAAILYSGDAGLAQLTAAEADNGVDILYSIPSEGTVMWVDLMAIPSDAENVAAAYAFIDYMLQPEVVADVTNTIWYANANAASVAHVLPEILADPGIYPEAETKSRLFPDMSLPAQTTRLRNRAWTRAKSGL
ncbi:extracellular solute-binding protein [Pseudodonghicola flavimaris]|uniref:Putrescine-binding periplasmic protein n=1 Tax=Pseudodonghicola flavimaris TaxID=3050036 RepID=A0ABT7F1T9_9RHOB|nr:extracellular solute-binding protein [Pseudodonghicola flavimaris]MDK3018572.1 extracellular solute-binding protein [Pseudodonghicola flavimaris]